MNALCADHHRREITGQARCTRTVVPAADALWMSWVVYGCPDRIG
jgi:hypothetical protein